MSKSTPKKNHFFQLIFTVALKQELPLEWLKNRAPVLTLSAVESGQLQRTNSERGILFLVTGVGPEASKRAAGCILKHFSPLFVVNLGTAGAVNGEHSHTLGELVYPKYLSISGKTVPINTYPLPFPNTLSSPKGRLASVPTDCIDYIDMESAIQAEAFKAEPFHFHILKVVSDFHNHQTASSFQKALPLCRKTIRRLLQFLSISPPKISTIIPTFNRRHTLNRAIQSVLNQDYPCQELIIIDDGSNDGTQKLINALQKKAPQHTDIRFARLKSNHGVSTARNKGLSMAKNDWIAFLDSDDEWTSNKLKKQIQFLNRYPFYRLLQSEETWIRNGKHFNKKEYHIKKGGWIFSSCLERCMISMSSLLIHRELLSTRFDPSLPACEDYDLFLTLSRHYPVGLEPSDALIKYGGHSDQLSTKYLVMDQFRVRALSRLLQTENQDYFKEKILLVLEKKLTIILTGIRNRPTSILNDKQDTIYEQLFKVRKELGKT